LYHTASFPPGLNTSQYDGVDDLIDDAANERDMERRKALYGDVLRQTMTDLPVIPLFAEQLFMAHSDRVEGLEQNSLFTVHTYSVSLAG